VAGRARAPPCCEGKIREKIGVEARPDSSLLTIVFVKSITYDVRSRFTSGKSAARSREPTRGSEGASREGKDPAYWGPKCGS